MTYREQIQKSIQTLQNVYDEIGSLRDTCFSEHEKMYLNKSREILPTVWAQLQHLDNFIEDDIAGQVI